ncbi:APC family permease [Caproiciproducens sp. R1]|uniref:APC family permease n=1 Tax=Caproiciproducens sp. R1 TaxID=3435000 RepID=UPI0040347A3F
MSENQVQQKDQTLGLKELTALATGTVISAGLLTVIGPAISLTGRSVWLAFAAAVLFGLLLNLPFIFLSSVIRLRGGNYSLVRLLLGDIPGGVLVVNLIFLQLPFATSGIAMGMYINSLWPFLNPKLIGVLTPTIFLLINLLGIKSMSKVQNIITVLLIAGLLLFIGTGTVHLNAGTFDFSSTDYFPKGWSGFSSAMILLVFSTTMHQTVMNYGANAKDARRDMPWAIIITTGIILVIYTGMALVAGNVLPVAQVAGKPLTLVANKIMPQPLFFIFILFGAVGAIATTMNSLYASAAKPMQLGCQDGWFPKSLGKLNRFDVPYRIYFILYGFAVVPILFDMPLNTLINDTLLIQYLIKIIMLVAILRMPTKYPELWKASRYHVPNPVFYTLTGISFLAQIFLIVTAAGNLTTVIVTVSVALLALGCAYAFYRYKFGKVNLREVSSQDIV